MAKGKTIKLVTNNGNIQLKKAEAVVKRLTVASCKHIKDDGFHTVTRVVFEIPIDDVTSLANMNEGDIFAAIEAAGRKRAEKDGAQTYQLRIKRKMPAAEFTVVADDGGESVFLAAFKNVTLKAVEGELTMLLTVDGDIMADQLAMLAMMMDMPCKLSTISKQVDMFDGAQAA